MKKQFLYLAFTLLLFSACKKECPDMDPPAPSCTPELTKGLLAYYPFNGNNNDQSGNGNNATAMNGAYLTTDFLGRANNAAGFDGVNDYLIVPGSEKLNADSITVSFQVMVNNSNRRNVTISRIKFEDAKSLVFGIHETQPTDNKWSFGTQPGTDDCSKLYSYGEGQGIAEPGPIVAGRWYNIIVTFGNGAQKIYVDGVLKGSVTAPFTKLKKCASADLMIGGWWKNDIVSIDGKIDEVRLYSRVISDCEIAKLAETFKQ